MSKEKLTGYGLFLIVVALAFGWTAGKSNADEGLAQRISGLEARVTMLETEVAQLSDGSALSEDSSETYTIEIQMVAKKNDRARIARWYDQICYISADFKTGATFSAINESGIVIGTAQLENPTDKIPTTVEVNECVFSATLEVQEFEFLTLRFGDLESDPYSFEQVKSNDWVITLTSRS